MSQSIINRNTTYRQIAESLSKRQKQVYEAIMRQPNKTARFYAERIGTTINNVTGRIHELKELCYIEEGYTLIGKTGKPNTTYKPILSTTKICELRDKKIGGYKEIIDDLMFGSLGAYLIEKEVNKYKEKIKNLIKE